MELPNLSVSRTQTIRKIGTGRGKSKEKLTCFLPRYGFSRARYVYSLISGVGVFFIGAGVTMYHGVQNVIHPHVIGNIPVVRVEQVFCDSDQSVACLTAALSGQETLKLF